MGTIDKEWLRKARTRETPADTVESWIEIVGDYARAQIDDDGSVWATKAGGETYLVGQAELDHIVRLLEIGLI